LLWEQPGTWEVCEVELDPPQRGEVLVRVEATGLCHSDDHFAQGDLVLRHAPFCSGHEGAGVVEAVGPEVHTLEPGDRIVTVFIPSCGRCRPCVTGFQNLCDNGRLIVDGAQLDGTYRMHARGHDVAQNGMISTFSEYSVMPEVSCVKMPEDIPFRSGCLIACGVPTGWGSAVNLSGLSPGDVAIVMGVGGVGANAVQGCRHMGARRIIAADPVPFKRDLAMTLGATDAVSSIGEAAHLARSLTNGQGADAVIVTVGVTTGEHVAQACAALGKNGTVVATGVSNATGVPVNILDLVFYQKRIQGGLYGGTSPKALIPRLFELYRSGELLLDELVTRTYTLDEINKGYDDMRAGLNIRGVVELGHTPAP
jgi:S-(hydroxymethyl)glutathione dehydrogenase/alcohol dehydrogenase